MSALRLKVSIDGAETRRFALDGPVTHSRLRDLIQSVIGVDKFSIMYTDDEGELITIASDADLKEAITLTDEMKQKALKLSIVTHQSAVPVRPVLTQILNTNVQKVDFDREQKDFKNSESVKVVEEKESVNIAEQQELPKTEYQSFEDEKTTFDESLSYLNGQFSKLDFSLLQPEVLQLVFVLQNVTARAESGESLQWDGLIKEVSQAAPVISSLPCFHDESQKLLDALESVVKFFINRVESGLLYPIPPHLAPFMFVKSERFLKNVSRIRGIPLQLQVILEHFSAAVNKLEAVFTQPDLGSFEDQKVDQSVHVGVQCDNCQAVPIVGNRYKCTVCHNFDLCEACELSGIHPSDHEMIKFKVTFQRPERRHFGGFGPASFAGFVPNGFGVPNGACGGRGRRWKNSQCPWNKKAQGTCQKREEVSPVMVKEISKEGCGAEFVRDVNIPDKVHLGRGQMHVKTWAVRNDGKDSWDNGVKLIYVSGNRDILLDGQDRFDVPLLKSGETGDISIPFVVPKTPGNHKTVFAFSKNGQQFGHNVWVEFVSE